METNLHPSGSPRTTRRLVENVQRVASPPSIGVAREALMLRVSGVEQRVEIIRRPLPRGGQQGFWRCPRCGALRYHLYVLNGVLACRLCQGPLDYLSRHIVNQAVTRAAKLRRKLGAAPGLTGRLPPRPRHHKQAARYDKLRRALAKQEAIVAELLGATLRALKRQKERSDEQRQRAR